MLRTLTISTFLTLVPASLAQAPQESVVLLQDGSKVAGVVERTANGYRVRTGVTVRRLDSADVVRWIPRSELLEKFDGLAAHPSASSAFQTAQRALWAFENGLADRAWPLLGRLVDGNASPASMAKLEKAAAHHLITHAKRTPNRVELGRQLLLAVQARRKDSVTRAKNRATSRAVRELLEQERRAASQTKRGVAETTKKGKKTLANICRKYAAEAVSPVRRGIARRALLAFDEKGKEFVWRQAMLWPRGPTRSAVTAEIDAAKQTDDAALYLARFLKHRSSTIKVRSAEALGELGSAKALPALHAMRKSVREMARKRRAGGAGSTRGNVAFLTQQSYIRDFNVEIAQASAVADPVVDVIQSGVVLDATVGGIAWDRYIVLLDSTAKRAINEIERRQ